MFTISPGNCVLTLFFFSLVASNEVNKNVNSHSYNTRIKRHHHHGYDAWQWGHPQSNPGFTGYHQPRPQNTWDYQQQYDQEHFNYNIQKPNVISYYDPYTDPNFSLTKNVPIPHKIYFNKHPIQQVYQLVQPSNIPYVEQEKYLNRELVNYNANFISRPEEIHTYYDPTQIHVYSQISNGQTTQTQINSYPTNVPQNTGLINNSQNNMDSDYDYDSEDNTNNNYNDNSQNSMVPNFGDNSQNVPNSDNNNSQNTVNGASAEFTNKILSSSINPSLFGPGINLQGQIIGPTGALIPAPSSTIDGPDPINCNQPYNPPSMPNFERPGRSLGEARCYDYIFQLKVKDDMGRRNRTCNRSDVLAEEEEGTEEFSHMVAIGWRGFYEPILFKCGGALISPNFILTAAHCSSSEPDPELTDLVPRVARIGGISIGFNKFGMAFRKPNNERRRRQSRNPNQIDVGIINIIPHENYRPNMVYYDIAVMQLASELDFNRRIKPACIWTNGLTNSRLQRSVATGWGLINASTRRTSLILQASELDLIDKNVCNNMLRGQFGSNFSGFADHQICAGKLSGDIDVCQGNSGGLLQVNIRTPVTTIGNMHSLIGVLAAAPDCVNRTPGIYTNIANFADWIEVKVWGK